MTSGVAAAAYAGIPVTHRDAASAVALITGHEDPGEGGERARLGRSARRSPGRSSSTWACSRLPEIAARLAEAGRGDEEPVAVVERGTLPGQRAVRGTLGDIAGRVAEAGIKPPAITLVGPVARLRDGLAWLESRPLHGQRVVVTRARAQASGLAATLRGLGAEVIEAPAIRIEPRPVEAELTRLRPRLLHEPQRRRPVFRRACPTWQGRALAGRLAGGRDRAGDRARAPRTGHPARCDPGAQRRGVAGRIPVAARCRRQAGARRSRRRSARRAPGRAGRARGRGIRRPALRHGQRGDRRGRGGRDRRGRLRHVHLQLDGRPLPRRRLGAAPVPAWRRSAR